MYLAHARYVLKSNNIKEEMQERRALVHKFVMWDRRYNKAAKLFLEVAEIIASVFREEHKDTLSSIGNLASMYSKQGRWNKAKELRVQVIETLKKMFGEEHPTTLSNMANLASTY